MKIIFIYPRFDKHSDVHPELVNYVPHDKYFGPPSLAFANLAALTPNDVEIEFIDDRITPFDIKKNDADLFAISSFTPSASRAIKIGKGLIKNSKKVILGGIFPTNMPQEVTQACTSVIIGEGESAWPRVIEDFKRKQLKPIYKSNKKFNFFNAKKPKTDLYFNTYPKKYHDLPLQICRGCFLSCDACTIPSVMGCNINFLNTSTILEAAFDIINSGHRISLTEDTLLFDLHKTKTSSVLDALYRKNNNQKLNLHYIGTSVPLLNTLDPKMYKLLCKIGLQKFYIVCGFDPITRNAFGAGDKFALQICEKVVCGCMEVGIEPYVSFLVGNDTDDRNIFDRIIKFGKKTKLNIAEFAILTPYPGTPVWHKFIKQNRINTKKWEKYNDANVVFSPKNMSEKELLKGYLSLWKEFYKNKKDLNKGIKYNIQF